MPPWFSLLIPLAKLGRLAHNRGMSKIAGIVLLILGGFVVYLGVTEIRHMEFLTPRAAYTTTAAGALLVIAGLLHFKAPHKAFLLSIPFLLLLQVVVFSVSHYFMDQRRWLYYQILVGLTSLFTLFLSYRGYQQQKKASVQ